LAAVSAAALAAVGAFFNVLGNKAAEGIGHSEGAPISWSVEEMPTECFGGTFLPGAAAREALRHPAPADWQAFEETPGAAPANHDLIQVAVQGESERKVTLTGIRFHVEREDRPDGAVFGNPCGGPLTGRALVVDLDSSPPEIIASSAEVGAIVSLSREGQVPPSEGSASLGPSPSPTLSCSRSSPPPNTVTAPGPPKSPGLAARSEG